MRKKRPKYCWKSKGPWRSSNNTFNMFKSFIVKPYQCLIPRQNIYQQSSILTFTLILKAEYLLTEAINFGISLIACSSHNIYDNLLSSLQRAINSCTFCTSIRNFIFTHWHLISFLFSNFGLFLSHLMYSYWINKDFFRYCTFVLRERN